VTNDSRPAHSARGSEVWLLIASRSPLETLRAPSWWVVHDGRLLPIQVLGAGVVRSMAGRSHRARNLGVMGRKFPLQRQLPSQGKWLSSEPLLALRGCAR
jgi:hypothetical protein